MFLNILPMTQLLEWLLEQFKNKKQLFVVLKKTAITLILSNISNIHREKLCFIQLSTRTHRYRCLDAPDFFHIFTQFVKLFTFHCGILNSANFLRRWLTKLPENERLFLSPFSNFYSKSELVSHLTQKSILYKMLNLQTNRKSIGYSKKRYKWFSKELTI